jgi:hypothetical protein
LADALKSLELSGAGIKEEDVRRKKGTRSIVLCIPFQNRFAVKHVTKKVTLEKL